RILVALALAAGAQAQQYPDPPQVLFKDLYAAVEMEHVFADSKEFADAVPRSTPAEILKLYHSQKPPSPSAFKKFLEKQFHLPQPALDLAQPATPASIRQHITALWDHLEREARTPPLHSSLVPLPRPFVVPGARFRELYYWDSYFVMLGLAESGRKDLLQDMVANFAYLIDTYGHIPNGNRTYYLSRSQPPFFFKMVGLLSPDDEAAAFAQYLPQLQKE